MKSLICLLLLAGTLDAEMLFKGNPAFVDRQDAMRLNPALAAWQPLAFSIDWSILQGGLLSNVAAIQQGGLQFSAPRYNVVGLIDHRNIDLLSETELCVDWAFRLGQNASLGLEVGARHFGWNRSLLDDELLQDPVFDSGLQRWQPLVGFGAYWSPISRLHAALGIKHLNRPSLALSGSEDRAPLRLYSGLMWTGRQIRLGLSVDNTQNVLADRSIVSSLSNLLLSGQIGWKALDHLDLTASLSSEELGVDIDLQLPSGHTLGYVLEWPLGELAEYSSGTHRLRYRFSLGGALMPGSSRPGIPVSLPVDEWQKGRLSSLFGRQWNPAITPIELKVLSPQIEILELHITVTDRLSSVLLEEGINPFDLAMSGVIQGGRRIDPTRSGVVEETYSPAWWQLAGLIEELAWDQGLDPVIHVGEESLRATELANLLGAPLELPGGGALGLPSGTRLLLPDTLKVRCELEPEIERLCGDWNLSLELPGGARVASTGRGVPPALLELALPAVEPERGYALLTLDVNDEDDRLMIHRVMELPVLLRVRNTHLDLGDDVDVDDVDSIHLHLSK
jgi:hypothetical protein